MKIIHIPTGGLFPDGIFSCITEYINAMERDDIQFDLIATNDPKEDVVEIIDTLGCSVINIPYRKDSILKYSFKLVKYLKSNRYDIVHVHGSSGIMIVELLAAKIAGCKVRIAHSHNTTCENKIADKILRPIFKQLYTHAFACGYDAGKWLFSNNEFKIIPNGRDLKKLEFDNCKRKRFRKELKLDDNLVIGHVGRFNEQKNHVFLIEIFAEIKARNDNAKLVLIGDGELISTIQNKVRELDLSDDVIFMGSINNVNEILSAMDIMVLPSLYEGLPLVVLEWQASGLPCYISDCITKECIVNSNVISLTLEVGAKVWADEILNTKLVNRYESRKKVFENMISAGFDIETNAKYLKKLYYEAIKIKN